MPHNGMKILTLLPWGAWAVFKVFTDRKDAESELKYWRKRMTWQLKLVEVICGCTLEVAS
jgi:hypothetical protein